MWVKTSQWSADFKFKLHWFFVVLTAFVVPFLTRNHPVKAQRGEWYPFSNFPMYSNFEPTAYYVFITDLDDKPLAISPTFGTWPTNVKKAYDAKLKDVARALNKPSKKLTPEECQPVAEDVLKQLRESSKFPDEVKKHAGLRLHAMDIWLEDGRIMQKSRMVGEIK
jgi:hypothetical protein